MNTIQNLFFDLDRSFARQARHKHGPHYNYRKQNFTVQFSYEDGYADFRCIMFGKVLGEESIKVSRDGAQIIRKIFNANRREI